MDSALLRRYVKLILSETPLARVPTQLMPPKDNGEVKKDDELDDENELDEFSGCGAVAGFTAPLGMDSDPSKRKKK